MLIKSIILSVVLLAVMGAGIVLGLNSAVTSPNDVLFDNPTWQNVLIGVAVAGIILGAARGIFKKKPEIKGDVVIRHGMGSFISHWATAIGIFGAMASGIIMGLSLIWFNVGPFAHTPGAMVAPQNVHYFAVAMAIFGGFFFVGDYIFGRNWTMLIPNLQDVIQGFIGKYMLRRKWEKEGRYLSSQKAAFVPYILIGLVMLASGAVKVAAHRLDITADVWGWATVIHDWFTVFIILYTIVHVIIVLALGHWPYFLSWFTGSVSKELIEHHNPIWYEELTGGKKG